MEAERSQYAHSAPFVSAKRAVSSSSSKWTTVPPVRLVLRPVYEVFQEIQPLDW